MARFLTGRPITLAHIFFDYDGDEPLSPTTASVTVTSLSDAGFTPVTQTATLTNGEWRAPMPSLPVGEYLAAWTGTGSVSVSDSVPFEVTGSILFTVPEARASDPDLADATEYPPADISHYRTVIEQEFETITGRSFVRRLKTVEIEAPAGDAVWTKLLDCASLEAISGPDGALVVSDYRLDANGVLSGLDSFAPGDVLNVTVRYGMASVPLDIKRAALKRLQYLLASEDSGIPDRATMMQAASGGMFYFATAGRGNNSTGLPEVDAVLNLYSTRVLRDILGVFA